MDFSIAAVLAQDGIINAAIYALMAMALVLLFSITRIIFVAQGEFVAFGALTFAGLQVGHFPVLLWLMLALGAGTFVLDLGMWLWRRSQGERGNGHLLLGSVALNLLLPLALSAALHGRDLSGAGFVAHLVLTLLIVVPIGSMVYRLAFQPVAEASVLVLLIISTAVHFMMLGVGLLAFGPEGSNLAPMTTASWSLGGVPISGQGLVVIVVSVALIASLFAFFSHTLTGKALRATAINRSGARLMGISPSYAGKLAFTLAAALGVVAGVLAGPLTTMQYDTGFLVSLKGFVAAIVGGLASYPLAAAGALLVGLIESYGSFWASAYKEIIVFTLIIPVLLWRSLTTRHVEED